MGVTNEQLLELVSTMAVKLAEVNEKIEMALSDIIYLDKRTQPLEDNELCEECTAEIEETVSDTLEILEAISNVRD